MEDHEITARFLTRDESVLQAVQTQYGAYLQTIALHILGDPRDAEECLNDALLQLWNRIPPVIPTSFRAYAAKTVRNAALTRYQSETRKKRGGGEASAVFEELEGVLAAGTDVESAYAQKELLAAVQRFVKALPPREQKLFLRRYFFAEPLRQIAEECGLSETNVRVILSRTRGKLKKYLRKEGLEQ